MLQETDNTPLTDTLSLGQQFKQAREVLNLSVEEVAEKTLLKKSHIESFENDIFILKRVPPAFVKGYVRNYLRFLRLPEEWIHSVQYGEVIVPKKAKPITPIKISNVRSQTRWLKWLSSLVLLVALGMTLTWWWQEYQKDQQSRDQLVRTQEYNMVDLDNSVNILDSNILVNNSNGDSSVNNTIDSDTAAPSANTNEVSPVAPSLSVPLDASQNVQEEKTPQTETSRSEDIPQQSTTAEPTMDTVDTQKAVITDELRIEITQGQSWISVKDTKNKRLAEKLYNAGDVLSFNDYGQYQLIIGAPINVKIYYQGQDVPLQIDGRVARFKLPLAK